MAVDGSRDRVFIRNLDEEIAEAESEDEKLIFLPDIERKLARLPKSVLLADHATPSGNEVVLYSVPESLSIPKDQDNVRKAIIESRHRAQLKQITHSDAPRLPNSASAEKNPRPPAIDCEQASQALESASQDMDAMEIG